MAKQSETGDSKPKAPIKAMSTQTFVKEYKGQAQMNINTISGLNFSGQGCEMKRKIYEALADKK